MPRVKKKAKRRRAGYGSDHIEHLLYGVYLSIGHGFCIGPHHQVDDDAMRSAWQLLREELLAQWVKDHPGTRPCAWWKFDCPELRRRVDGKPHPFDNLERQAEVRRRVAEFGGEEEMYYALYYGRPRCLFMHDDFEAQYEENWTYLERLGLLLPGEEKNELMRIRLDEATCWR